MYFTSIIAVAVLAYTAVAVPAPCPTCYDTSMSMETATTMRTLTASKTGVSYVPYPTGSSPQSNYTGSATHSQDYTSTKTLPTTATVSLPYESGIAQTKVDSSTMLPPQQTSLPPSTTNGALSLTQQLFIADTAVDRFNLLPSNSDFLFDFNDPKGTQTKANKGKDGRIIKADRKAFPALVGTGSGMAVGFLGPCGFNTPHVHPRSVELQIVTQGSLFVEMLPENGVLNADGKRRVISNQVAVNQMTPFYQGSVHTQFNPTCSDATFVSAFNSEDFGAGSIADELFAFDSDIVTAAFGEAINGADVDNFKGAIPASIAFGVEQCLRTCNIAKSTQ